MSLSLPVEASISAKIWTRLPRGWVYRWITSDVALVLIQGCRCSMGEDQSLRWIKDYVGHFLPFHDHDLRLANNHRWKRWSGSRSSSVQGNCLLTWGDSTNQSCRRGAKEGTVTGYQPQLPSSHNLERYLSITSSLIPRDSALSHFCIRHPDFQHNDIIVSRSLDSGCQVVGLIDWQHTSILPMFLLAGVPQRL